MSKPRTETLTLAEVSKHLRYEPETGYFFWLRDTRRGQRAGDRAGWIHKATGYVYVGLLRKKFRGNRLAWLFITGEWPPVGFEVEHKNRIKSEDWKDNLRLATRSQNNANIPTNKRNKSGYRGVSWCNRERRWIAQIVVDGRRTFLGQFIEKQDAVDAYNSTFKEIFGEFAATLS